VVSCRYRQTDCSFATSKPWPHKEPEKKADRVFSPARRETECSDNRKCFFSLDSTTVRGAWWKIGLFREPPGDNMALKQSVVNPLLTLIGSHNLHFHPCMQL